MHISDSVKDGEIQNRSYIFDLINSGKGEQFFKEIDNKTIAELIKEYCPKSGIIKRIYRKSYSSAY